MLVSLGEYDAALAESQRGMALFAKLAADSAMSPDYRQDLAKSHRALGAALIGAGQREEALAQCREATVVLENKFI